MNPRDRLGPRLAATMEQAIHSGQWATGSKLPAERELAEQFSLSRQTVREALDELERDGLVTRRHGSGTYVAARRLEQSLLTHFSIVESLRSAGAEVGTTLLSQRVTRATPPVAHELELGKGAGVLELERLRTVDGIPFMFERTWFPGALLQHVEPAALAGSGLYDTLRVQHDIVLVSAVESFEPVLLPAREARLLQDEAARPALMLIRTAYDTGGRPVETARAFVRADRCRTLVERRVSEPDRP